MRRWLAVLLVLGCGTPATMVDPGLALDVSSAPPSAAVVAACSGGLCTFDGTGSTDDQGVVAYEWRPCASCNVLSTASAFSMSLSPRTRTWTLTVYDAEGQSDVETFTFTSPDGPGWPITTQIVRYLTGGGCSNTERAFRGLARYSGWPVATPGFKKDSLPGGTLSRYLREDPEKWPPHDRWMAALRPGSAQTAPTGDVFWFQVCVFVNQPDSMELRRAYEVLDSLRRYRPETEVVISGLGQDPTGQCTWAGFVRSEWLADSLVARGYGRRGPSVVLLPGDFEVDGCHPGTQGQNKWGQALKAFAW